MAADAQVDDFLPLRPNDLHILLALTAGQKHGYRIAKEIEEDTEGRIRLEAGNLHRTVQKLIRMGLVEVSAQPPAEDSGDERRRYYAITPLGRRVVRADVERMRDLVDAVESRGVFRKGRTA